MNKDISYIKFDAKKYKKEYSLFFKLIEKYDRICVFRHIKPDFDALGTQLGLVTWLKDNFPSKEIKMVGDNHVAFTPRGLYPVMDVIKDNWFDTPFLAIIVDVGDQKRIADPRFLKGEFKFKLDHHPKTDDIFDAEITDTTKAAASELVASLLISNKKYKLSKLAAHYFYTGLVGDSGRFQFGSTSPLTFEVSKKLLETGIEIVPTYELMYQKSIADLEVLRFIISNYKISKHGVAYYIMTQKDLTNLGLASEQGKDNVNFFSNYKGINIWCSITEDITEPCFRISIRSRNYKINDVATEFKGGGHAQAAGAQIKDLSELDKFISALDNIVINNVK